jgi:hypothetical protein
MITGYREQPKMGPSPKSSTTANTTRSITVGSRSQPNASLAIRGSQEYSQRMGPMLPSNYQQRSAPVSLTVGSGDPDRLAKQDQYKTRYASQIAEANRKGNFDIPRIIADSLRWSRVATPSDFADFKDTFQGYDHGLSNWKKWGGGNKMGSAGAAVNAARRAQKARRDAQKAARDNPFSIPSLNNVLMAGDNRGLNRSRDYDVNTGDLKGITTDSDFGRRMRDAVYGSSPKA